MAKDNKTINIENLKEVRERFGPKLPNGKNENPIFAMMDLVVGAMSAIGWGNPKRHYSDFNGLLNDKNNIYNLVNDIKESLDPTKIKKASLLSYTKSNNDILKEIKNSISNNSNSSIIDSLNNIKESISNQQNESSIKNIKIEDIDISKLEDKIKKIKIEDIDTSKLEDKFKSLLNQFSDIKLSIDESSIKNIKIEDIDTSKLEDKFKSLLNQFSDIKLSIDESSIKNIKIEDIDISKLEDKIKKIKIEDIDISKLEDKIKSLLNQFNNIKLSIDESSIKNIKIDKISLDKTNIDDIKTNIDDIIITLQSEIEQSLNNLSINIILDEKSKKELESYFKSLKTTINTDFTEIYENIINESIKNINENLKLIDLNGFSENLKNELNKIITDTLNISISLNSESNENIKQLTESLNNSNINSLSNIDFNAFITSIDNFTTVINDILSNIENDKRLDFIFNFDIDSSDLEKFSKIDSKIFKDISEIIDPNKNKNFQSFIRSLQKLDLQKIEGLEDISKFLSSFVSILSMDKIKDKNVKLLSELTSETGYLTKIIQNLQDPIWKTQINSNTKNNIEIIESLFEALQKIVELKYWDIKKSNFILNYINKDYFNKIKNVIENVNSLYKYSEKVDIDDKIEALENIIDIIPKIASVSIFDILWSKISIKYLNDYIENDIPIIFETLEKTLSKYKDSYKDIEQLTTCIDSILKIFELDQTKIADSSENIDMISDIMSGELKKLFKIIYKNYNEEDLEKILENVENIHGILEMLNFDEALPSILSLTKTLIKLSLIQEETNIINDILNPKKYPFLNFKRENKTDEIIKNLKQFKKVLKVLEDVNGSLENITIKSVIKILSNVSLELIAIDNVFKKLQNIDTEYKTAIEFKGIKKTIKNFNNSLDLLKESYDEEISKISGISSLINSFLMLLNEIDTEELSDKANTIGDFIVNSMSEILKKFENDSDLGVSIRAMLQVEAKDIENIENIEKIITKLALMSSSKLLSKISEEGLKLLEKAADKLYCIVDKLKDIKKEDLEGANKTLSMLMKVIVGSAAILLFGSIMMYYINPLNLLMFALALGGFITGVLFVYSKLSKDTLESSFNAAYDLALLIAISGATLIFGSLLFHFINIEDLLGYTFSLATFIFAIIGTYALFNKHIENTFSSAFDLGLLIVISGGTLIFGSILYHFINWKDLTGFTIALGSFMFVMLGIYAFFNKWFINSLKGAKDFAILIGVSAGLLILGGLLGKWVWNNFGTIMGFGLALSIFVGVFGLIWCGFSLIFKSALKGAKEFAILILTSAAVMILGPLIINELGDHLGENPYLSIFKFAGTLALFVIGIGFALWLASLNEKKSLMAAIGLSVVVGVCAYALVYGPVYMKDKGVDFYTDVIPFAIGLLVFTVLMGGIIALLGQMDWSTLIKGTLCVVVIGLITLGAAYVMTEFYNAVKNINHNILLKGIFKTGEVFGAFAALIIGLGALVTGPQAILIGAGATALGVLEGLVWGAAKVINAIAISMININKAANLIKKDQFERIYDIIKCFGTALTLLADKISLKTSGKLTAIMPSILMGVAGLSMIGNVIKDWANMWVPDIDPKTGKTKGYRKLYNADIQNAGINIGKVLTAIGTAIKKVIGDPNNKEIFSEGLFSGKSPFRVAMESFKYSGQILSSIAQGIKDWSSMAIPTEFDNTGKPKGYTSLNDDILGHAQENIQKVLLGIGLAIANVVKEDKNNIFKLGKNSPAIIAAEAINTTSKALTNIVAILQKFASKDFETIVNKLHGIDKDHPGIIDNITKTLGGIIEIISLFLKPVKGTGIIWDDSFAEYLNKNKNELINAKDTINEFANTVISIFGSIGSIGESYMMYEQNIKYIADKNKSGIIYGALLHIKVLFNKLVDINRTLTGYNLNINTMLNSFDQFSKMLILYVESAERFDENTNKNLDLLINGIIKLYTTTSKWGTNNVFTQYVQDVKDFVKSINDLSIDKLSTMNNLISAMSELATKLGNVDGLVDALANKLAPIIVELVTQLQKAEATIKNAHELQRARQDLIDKSVKKVKELMDQHMIVEVLRGDDSGNTPTISSGGGNNYQGGSNNTPTNNDAETPLESPEDAGQQQATGSAEKVKEYNPFYMGENIAETAAKKVVNAIFKKWGG